MVLERKEETVYRYKGYKDERGLRYVVKVEVLLEPRARA